MKITRMRLPAPNVSAWEIRFRLKQYVYPHNDLRDMADYHIGNILLKISQKSTNGLRYECMSSVIALAFSVEALINMVGWWRVPDWVERDKFAAKTRVLEKRFHIRLDKDTEPFKSIMQLKKIRDDLAHAKPELRKYSGVGEGRGLELAPSWAKQVTTERVLDFHQQVRQFEADLLRVARIQIQNSSSNGTRSREFIPLSTKQARMTITERSSRQRSNASQHHLGKSLITVSSEAVVTALGQLVDVVEQANTRRYWLGSSHRRSGRWHRRWPVDK